MEAKSRSSLILGTNTAAVLVAINTLEECVNTLRGVMTLTKPICDKIEQSCNKGLN
jgi:hypothetical protein